MLKQEVLPKVQQSQIRSTPFVLKTNSIESHVSYLNDNHFQFLNLHHQFPEIIDWNYAAHGKLWTYNLTYFEFLCQAEMSKKRGLSLIQNFMAEENKIKDGFEPYPISLRSIFWIKFLTKYQIQDLEIDAFLYRQLLLLSKRVEYHLLGNHLLENGFALLFGACYFEEKRFSALAIKILNAELEEQILEDGAHFELSPMYHQILLYRLLDSINLLESLDKNELKDTLLPLVRSKSMAMLAWLKSMQFKNGTLAHFNDSTEGIAPKTIDLFEYAKRLSLPIGTNKLTSSAYRKHETDLYEIVLDIGNIGPTYIPGHAHSDTFNFELQYNNQPLIVDRGISTYEKNASRQSERATASHNTVMIENLEQSEVWGGFRVARRAETTVLTDTKTKICAEHNGYQHIQHKHKRTFNFSEHKIEISDQISGNKQAYFHLHFHPDITFEIQEETIKGKGWQIQFSSAVPIQQTTYIHCTGFNKTRAATKIIVPFKKDLATRIIFYENSFPHR